ATGDPPGDRPTETLIVQLRGSASRRAEVRLWAGPPEPARLVLSGPGVGLTLELPPRFDSPARPVRSQPRRTASAAELPPRPPRRPGAPLRARRAGVGDGTPPLGPARGDPRRPLSPDGRPAGPPRPRRRDPRDRGGRGGRPQPPSRADGRAALRGR